MRRAKQLIKSIVYSDALGGRALRWRAGNPLIFMYHGVTSDASQEDLHNCEGKHVHIDRFREQLRTLCRYRRPLSLRDLIEGLLEGRDLRNSFAITFDDGYENNYSQAANILSEMRIPSTFFLATGYIGSDRWLWVDRLEVALGRSRRSEVTIAGLGQVPLRDKRAALTTIKRFAKRQPENTVGELVDEVERQCEFQPAVPYGDYRFMNWNQVRELKAAGFEIGAHTVNHPILSRVDYQRGTREIIESRDRVREEVGTCSETFCYPNGKAIDFTPELVNFIAGHFSAALATELGPARASERYQLRRLGMPNTTDQTQLVGTLLREK